MTFLSAPLFLFSPKIKNTLLAALLLPCLWAPVRAQRIQLVHASADPTLAAADLYLTVKNAASTALLTDYFDDTLNNLAFRTATPLIALQSLPLTLTPTDYPLTVELKLESDTTTGQPGSPNPAGADATLTFTITDANTALYAVIHGVLVPADFAANPDNAAPATTELKVTTLNGIGTAIPAGEARTSWFHAVSDGNTINFWDDNFSQPWLAAASGYATGENRGSAAVYSTQLVAHTATDTLAAWLLDTAPWADDSVLVLASGFFAPAANQDGAGLAIHVFGSAGGAGTLVPLHTQPVQWLNNAAGTGVGTVDINVQLANLPGLGNVVSQTALDFRKGTAVSGIPARAPVSFSITKTTGGTSLLAWDDTLRTSESQVWMLAGVEPGAAAGTYAANPDGLDTTLAVYRYGTATTASAGQVALRYAAGVTDLAATDVLIPAGGGAFAAAVQYGSADPGSSQEVSAGALTADLKLNGQSAIIETYSANVAAFAGLGGLMFSSGFDVPSANNNGSSLGLYILWADGRVMRLLPPGAKLQLLHAMPQGVAVEAAITVRDDPSSELSRSAAVSPLNTSGLLTLPADTPTDLVLYPSGSNTPLATLQIPGLPQAEAAAVLLYPDGSNAAMTLKTGYLLDAAAGQTQVMLAHASPEAVTDEVALIPSDAAPLAAWQAPVAFGQWASTYSQQAPGTFTLDIRADAGLTTLETWNLTLASQQARTLVLAGSTDNGDFGLYMAQPDAAPMLPLALYEPSGIDKNIDRIKILAFPNPVQQGSMVNLILPDVQHADVQLFSITGQLIKEWSTSSDRGGACQLKLPENTGSAGNFILMVRTGGRVYHSFLQIDGL